MSKNFVSLHSHDTNSFLDGLSSTSGLVRRASELGQTALAITNHGVASSWVELEKQTKKYGIKPIYGIELYVADGKMNEKNDNFHLTALAQTTTGLHNLMKLSTLSYLEGFYRKPRIDLDLLEQYSNGIIILSGCAASQLSTYIINEENDKALELNDRYRSIFKDRYWLEIQHHGLDFDDLLVQEITKISKLSGVPLVATTDSHYTYPQDSIAHQVLLCVQTQSTLDNPSMSYGSNAFYLHSYEDITRIFGNIPESIKNTLEIADQCNASLDTEHQVVPHPPLPLNISAQDHLKQLLYKGLLSIYGNPLPNHIIERVKEELAVIQPAGFSEYFLLIQDIIRFAKKNNILYGVRGSVGGSLVAYGLGITSFDPIEQGTSFYRFLNPARLEPPDVDFDVQDNRRQEIIDYITDTYGHDKVSQILAIGTLGARATLRDVGRAMGLSLSLVDQVAKLVPYKRPDQGKVTLEYALDNVPELSQLYKSNPEVTRLFDTAFELEGVARHTSLHAAGIVVSSQPLIDVMPLYSTPKMNGAVSTQFTMEYLDRFKVQKIDILGLTQLSIMQATMDNVGKDELTFDSIPLDDPKTYELISTGNTFGVFQLGLSAGMRQLVKRDQPKCLDDVAAIVALYRPGPISFIDSYIKRHHNEEPVTYPHPAVEASLTSTYGIVVYQEQIINAVMDIAGFSPGEADLLRKAMGKKKIEEMKTYKERFVSGAIERKTNPVEADKLWDIVNAFSGYGFSRSHSVSYAIMAVKSAYLKANYPLEYMRALLTAERGDQEKVVEAIAECRRIGIQILPPDINKSERDFTIEGDAIRFGLGAIKGVGDTVADKITEFRLKDGPYDSLTNFVVRHSTKVANKGVFDAFAMAGALDELAERNEVIQNSDIIVKFMQKRRKMIGVGQMQLFEDTSEILLPDTPPATKTERLSWEREVVGTWLSENPLDEATEFLDGTLPINQVQELEVGDVIMTGGIVSNICASTTKKGDIMARIDISDTVSTIRCVIFPKTYKSYRHYIRDGTIIKVSAKVQEWNEQRELIIEGIVPFSQKEVVPVESFTVSITMEPSGDRTKDNETFVKLRSILKDHPGDDTVQFFIQENSHRRTFPLAQHGIKLDSTLENALHWLDPGLVVEVH